MNPLVAEVLDRVRGKVRRLALGRVIERLRLDAAFTELDVMLDMSGVELERLADLELGDPRACPQVERVPA